MSGGTVSSRLSETNFTLVHISDAHVAPWEADNWVTNPRNLREAVRFANNPAADVNAMVSTGDCIGNSIETSKVEAETYMQSFVNALYENNSIPTYFCMGNHDGNHLAKAGLSQTLAASDQNRFFKQASMNGRKMPSTKNYYYADIRNPQGGYIRIISLDMLEQPSDFTYNTQQTASFSQEQIDWLGNIALKEGMTDRHSVIIMTHYPFTSAFPEVRFVHGWSVIPEMIEAFRMRKALNRKFANIEARERSLGVNADFTDAQGEFVCYVAGHLHASMTLRVAGTLSNASASLPPQLMLLAPTMSPARTEGIPYNLALRTPGTVTSNAFNIYSINTVKKTVRIAFFGASLPEDDPSYNEATEISYL
jgi:predicted MPP superfamily phosphohydrolase